MNEMVDRATAPQPWPHIWKDGRCVCCRQIPENVGKRCYGVAAWMPVTRWTIQDTNNVTN